MFAMVTENALYVRVDEENRASSEATLRHSGVCIPAPRVGGQHPGAGTVSLASRSDIESQRHGKKQASRKYEE
jgi:hypothetical protein